MEFLDEESRPRFLFSKGSSSPIEPQTLKLNKTLASICIFLSILVIALSFFYVQSETLRFILLWLSLSLIVGPFAPISYTGGDIRVGEGEVLEQLDEDQTEQIDDSRKRTSNRKQKTRKSEDLSLNSNSTVPVIGSGIINSDKSKVKTEKPNGSVIQEEREWIDEDFELLKKQISKHPVGEPKRWELIAEAFQGRHGLESVIKMGKSLAERKPGSGDSFSQFLKQRKPLDKRLVEENGELDLIDNEGKKDHSNWSSGEDIALLNALKAFPKEASMRWEKITAAVPGKTKASCMKRVSELKNDFRSSKSSGDS